MITILDIPEQMISIMLHTNNVSIQDVVNFSSTCKHFRNIVENDNLLWRQKIYQRWPRLKKICEEQLSKDVDFKKILIACINSRKKLLHFLAEMNEINYYNFAPYRKMKSISCVVSGPFRMYMRSINKKHLKLFLSKTHAFLPYYFLIDELKSLLETSEHKHDLTNIYYAKKLVPYLKYYHLRNVWQKFINYPAKQQLLEKMAILVAQWFLFDEDMFYSHILETELNNIAQQIIKHLGREHPMHPIFRISYKQFSFWKHNNIDENHWNNNDGRQILDIVCKILSELNFHGLLHSENTIIDHTRDHFLINYVIERKIGHVLLLGIIFQSVARRLGICCDLIYLPADYYVLIWKPKCNITNPEQSFYIDILPNGTFSIINTCSKLHHITSCLTKKCDIYGRINPLKLVLKLVEYTQMIKCFIIPGEPFLSKLIYLELQYLINPNDVRTIENLSIYYNSEGMSISSLITVLKKIKDNGNDPEEASYIQELLHHLILNRRILNQFINHTPKVRPRDMKFTVGMTVNIKNPCSTNRIGVIIGWMYNVQTDFICSWKNSFEQNYSWFYLVLCKDQMLYRVFQNEIIKYNSPIPINSEEIGRFFCEFKNGYYMPNKMMAKEYPEDTEYLITLMATTHTGSSPSRNLDDTHRHCVEHDTFQREHATVPQLNTVIKHSRTQNSLWTLIFKCAIKFLFFIVIWIFILFYMT